MRTTLLALLALVAACGSPSTQSLVEPPQDAQASDAADDDAATLDAGALDSGADAGHELDAGELLVDAGPRDLGADAGPAYPGDCVLVPQSGCEGGACRLVGDEALCLPVRGDPIGEGLPCEDGVTSDECAAGFSCQASKCTRLCIVGTACPDLMTTHGPRAMECRPTVTPTVGLCVVS